MTRRWQYPTWAVIDTKQLTLPEVTTPDKWWQAFSEPVRQHAGKLAFAAILTSGGIFQGDPSDFVEPEVVTVDKWYSAFSEPVRTPQRLHAALNPSTWDDTELLTQPEQTQLDKWFSSFSEPVRVKKPLPTAAYPSSWDDSDALTRPEVTSLDKWHQPLVEPTRPKTPLNVSFGEFRVELALEAEEEITLDKWWRPLEEPVRVKSRASEFPSTTNDTEGLTQPEVTSLDKWWRPLSEFLHRTKRSAAALEPASVIDVELLTQPEETLVSKWVPQTNEPVRVKKGLLTALQQAFFIDANIAAVPPAEEITLDKWYHPFSEPVLVKARASDFPAHTNDTEGLTLPEVTSLDKWFTALSEPVRTQPASLAGLLSDTDYVGEPSDVEPLAEFMGWFRDLAQPTYPRILPISNYPSSFYQDEISELDPTAERLAWYVDLSTPTLPKVRVAEFPAYTIDVDALTQPEVTSLDRWFSPFSEPVRLQPRSLAALISGEVQVGEQVDIDPIAEQLGWYRNLDLPTLPKPRVAEFPSFIIDGEALTLPETTTLDRWWQAFSEPVRVKARLHEALQRHFVTDTKVILEETITLDKWYVPLGEPIRIGDRLVVPFRLPASVGREYQVTVLLTKGLVSKEADQTHVSKEADQTHTSKESDQTKDSKRC